jgi:hypothetical protein
MKGNLNKFLAEIAPRAVAAPQQVQAPGETPFAASHVKLVRKELSPLVSRANGPLGCSFWCAILFASHQWLVGSCCEG